MSEKLIEKLQKEIEILKEEINNLRKEVDLKSNTIEDLYFEIDEKEYIIKSRGIDGCLSECTNGDAIPIPV